MYVCMYQLKKANKRKLAVQYFACLVLVATAAIEFIWNAFYFAHHFHSLATHLLVRYVPPACDVRCRYPLKHFFLGCCCFRSGGAGWLPLGDQHWHSCLNYMYLLSDMLPG